MPAAGCQVAALPAVADNSVESELLAAPGGLLPRRLGHRSWMQRPFIYSSSMFFLSALSPR